jgi:hypothetical protein
MCWYWNIFQLTGLGDLWRFFLFLSLCSWENVCCLFINQYHRAILKVFQQVSVEGLGDQGLGKYNSPHDSGTNVTDSSRSPAEWGWVDQFRHGLGFPGLGLGLVLFALVIFEIGSWFIPSAGLDYNLPIYYSYRAETTVTHHHAQLFIGYNGGLEKFLSGVGLNRDLPTSSS